MTSRATARTRKDPEETGTRKRKEVVLVKAEEENIKVSDGWMVRAGVGGKCQ